jgi:hypothetical protein
MLGERGFTTAARVVFEEPAKQRTHSRDAGRPETVGNGSPSAIGPKEGLTGGASGHAHAPGTAPNHPHGGFTIGDATVGGLAVGAGGYTLAPALTRYRAVTR